MLNRRDVLHHGLVAGAIAVLHATPARAAWQQAQQQKAAMPDEMTVNTSQQQQHFPPPDYGPLPAKLPPETKAVAGGASLKAHAHRHGMIAGAAVIVRSLDNDKALAELLADQYGMLVPEGELKWVALRPAQDQFNFTQSDALFQFAEQHKMLVRGHTLVWHNSVPKWLSDGASTLDVRKLLVEHIQTVVGRYRGRVHSWDVVNEAILPKDGQVDNLRKSLWFDAIGPDYLELAYRTAHAADPQARLTYNDYGVETDSADDAERRKAILALLRSMQQKKIPLDAVGIQAHIKAASPNRIGSDLAEYISAIQAMGLEVYLTELDVNEDDISSNEVSTRDAQVAETYRTFLRVALGNPAVKAMLTWGTSDRRTWLNDGPTHHRKQPNRPQRSLPFDPDYKPTPAFFAIRDSFDEAPKRSLSTPRRRETA